jgi:hypothetical protein
MSADAFRKYLHQLPEELLQQVSEDYAWLSQLKFPGATGAEFTWRKECSRAEIARRKWLRILLRGGNLQVVDHAYDMRRSAGDRFDFRAGGV